MHRSIWVMAKIIDTKLIVWKEILWKSVITKQRNDFLAIHQTRGS